jgi:hypothetical protein
VCQLPELGVRVCLAVGCEGCGRGNGCKSATLGYSARPGGFRVCMAGGRESLDCLDWSHAVCARPAVLLSSSGLLPCKLRSEASVGFCYYRSVIILSVFADTIGRYATIGRCYYCRLCLGVLCTAPVSRRVQCLQLHGFPDTGLCDPGHMRLSSLLLSADQKTHATQPVVVGRLGVRCIVVCCTQLSGAAATRARTDGPACGWTPLFIASAAAEVCFGCL